MYFKHPKHENRSSSDVTRIEGSMLWGVTFLELFKVDVTGATTEDDDDWGAITWLSSSGNS